MNTTIPSRMSLIMDLIRPELSELSVTELEKLPYLTLPTVYNPGSANINQSALNLMTIYMANRSRISLIMGIIGPEHSELFAL